MYGMPGAERFFAIRVKISFRQIGSQGLNYKIYFYLALQTRLKNLLNHIQNFFPDYKNHFAEARTDGIKNRIVHNGLPMGSKTINLLVSPIPTAYSGC